MDRPAPVSANKSHMFYGWNIVIAAMLVTTVTYGIIYSFGVLLPYYQQTFHTDAAAISGAYSLCLLAYTFFAIAAGLAIDKFDPRITTLIGGILLTVGLFLCSRATQLWQLYIGYIISGIGMSPLYNPLLTTVSRWFFRRRGLAIGIVAMGVGIGPLAFAPLLTRMIIALGWPTALLILGLSGGAVIIACSFVMKAYPADMHLYPDGKAQKDTPSAAAGYYAKGLTMKEGLRTRTLWLLFFVSITFGFGLQVLMSYLVSYSESRSLDPIVASLVLSTISGVSIVGRLVMGTISDRISLVKGVALCLFGQGLMIFCFAFAANYWMLFLIGAVEGFFYGGYVPQLPGLVSENLGLAHLGALLGVTSAGWGIGSAVSPYVGGYIIDTWGKYPPVFIMGGIVVVLGGVACLYVKKPEQMR
jgi:MFS family permease